MEYESYVFPIEKLVILANLVVQILEKMTIQHCQKLEDGVLHMC